MEIRTSPASPLPTTAYRPLPTTMETTVKAQHFSTYSPPEHYPSVRQSSGGGPSFVSLSAFNESPPTIYARGELGPPFVQPAVYGDKDTQAELRSKFEEGADLKVVTYFTPLASEIESFNFFAEKLNRWGNGLVKEKFAKNSKNSRFSSASVLRQDDGSVKITVNLPVLSNLKDAQGWESYWSWPRGIYDVIFQISSFWVSPQGCGFTFKACRIALVEAKVAAAKALAPEFYEFGNHYDAPQEEKRDGTPDAIVKGILGILQRRGGASGSEELRYLTE